MKKILSFGEVIWDVYDQKAVIGGAALNFAAHASKCGLDSFLLSAVGNDELGERAVELAQGFGVSTDLIQRTDKQTGKCLVTLDTRGVPNYRVLDDVAYDNITITDEDVEAICALAPDALYFGTLIQRNAVSRATLRKLCERCAFEEIVCDVNLRNNCYDRDSVEFCLSKATVLKVSDEEEPTLREMGVFACEQYSHLAITKAICEKYPQIKHILLTCGEKGCFVYSAKTGEHFYQDAQKVKVASTVGAGDSFFAAFVASYLSGRSVEDAVKLGSCLSGFVVSRTGAIPDYTVENGNVVPAVLYDMHVHSSNSHDSTTPVGDSAEACAEKGISGFAVTDHFDVQYHDTLDIMGVVDGSVRDCETVASEYEGRVDALRGIEIGEGIWHGESVSAVMSKHSFDVVLGSVHAVRYKELSMPYSKIDFGKLSIDVIYEYLDKYFDEVVEMIESVPCDVVSHLTCPLRYINSKFGRGVDVTRFESKIERVLRLIVEKSLALEVNTSCDDFLMPEEWIIKRYKELGGELVTLGSDAHVSQNVGKNFDKAIEVLKRCGFEKCYYYKNRIANSYKI
ncbi:MAG: histidinol-phosphatase HisJ family protein [Ruminococcaceae bacterium]|nr:histidinol-phosphatase HisJ family protein [Oscillospiraceae bacterium]